MKTEHPGAVVRHPRLTLKRSAALALVAMVAMCMGTQAHAEPVPEGGPLTTGYGYDANGNLTQINLPKGEGQPKARENTHSYDSLGRRSASVLAAPEPGASAPRIGYRYDGLDQLNKVTDPRKLETTYTTSGLGETSRLASPDTGLSKATFYDDGLLWTLTDARGKKSTYEYDGLGRLTKISYSSGKPSEFEYDGGPTPPNQNSVGQLSKLSDESGSTTYTHDGLGRVLSKTQLVKNDGTSRTLVLSQGWGDNDGRASGKLLNQTYASLARLNYGYDEHGRLQSISLNPVKANGKATNLGQTIPLLSKINYDALGQIKGWNWGGSNGVAYSRGIDEHGRLSSYPLGNPYGSGKAAGLFRTIGYDAAGRIVSYTHTDGSGQAKPAFDQQFGYDGLDRLTEQRLKASEYGYDYDLSHNRISQTLAGTTYPNTIDDKSNRLMKERRGGPVVEFQYDDAGNIKTDGSNTFSFSDRGRLAKVSNAAGAVSYLYNALEQRVLKSGTPVDSGTRYYVYDEQGHLVGDYDKNGVPSYEVVYLGNTPVAVITQTRTGSGDTLNISTQLSYLYADHIDTPRIIVRANDHAIQWRWDQVEAFGNSAPNEDPNGLGSFSFNLRFPGQSFDKESGLSYNHHRDYRAQSGRYVQSDPIGLNGGINTYVYANDAPTKFTDPLGLKTLQCTKPLNAMGGSGSKSGPDMWGNPLYHQYSCIVRDGKTVCGGQDRGEDGAGKPSNDSMDAGQCKETEPDNNCFEQCLAREWAKPRPKYGIPFGTDCQEYDDDVNQRCRTQCEKK